MAFGVVDGVSWDATGLEVLEDVVVLFFRQVVVVTVDIRYHSLPCGRRRRGRGDVDKFDVSSLQFFFKRRHRFMACTTRAAPCGPHVDEHSLTLIIAEDGLEDVLWGHIVVFLEEHALIAGQFLGYLLLVLRIDIGMNLCQLVFKAFWRTGSDGLFHFFQLFHVWEVFSYHCRFGYAQ